ncbi:MAG: flagellar basal-body MS-ring/collar protein FliF [Chitinispirillaceae bacterium]
MSEFFRQLIAQLSAVWQKLSFQQKLVTTSLVGFTLLGLVGLLIFAHNSGGGAGNTEKGFKVLYSDLELEEASEITEQLQSGNYKYKLQDNGRTILVKGEELYEVRMALAREGLPRRRGVGYELFDKTNFGMTDYVQKLNARRALEGELQRTVMGLEEVKTARVHIVIPENTIFLEQQKDSKASVVIRCLPGRQLDKGQIRGITHLVSSSVDGLEPQNISVVDFEGKLLSNPFGEDETAFVSSRNMELQRNVESYLENKANQMLANVFGHSKAHVKVAADLDFDQVEKTMEEYDPEKRVIRSEERSEETKKNAPDGDKTTESSLTNYEIDKTVQRVVQEVGNIKRLTVSVAVDGKYETGEDGEKVYVERSVEELQNIEDLVKNSVGYDLARGDQIAVSAIQFDNQLLRTDQEQMRDKPFWEDWTMLVKIGLGILIAVIFLLLIRSVAKTIGEAMNPPVPVLEKMGGDEKEVQVEVPQSVKRSSVILEKVETLTNEEPVNISAIIRQWLSEPPSSKHKQ